MAARLVFTESHGTPLEQARDEPGTLHGCGITELGLNPTYLSCDLKQLA